MEIMTPNILLALMITSYAVPIVFVYFKYAAATATATATATDSSVCRSISSIITSTESFCLFTQFQTRYFIALCMLTMAGFTVLYEIKRPVSMNDGLSPPSLSSSAGYSVLFLSPSKTRHTTYLQARYSSPSLGL